MRAIPTRLDGPVVLEPRVFADERGFFTETYRLQWHHQAGIPAQERFVQDNHSRSSRGVVRGMHFHVGEGVAKLVRCARGAILDVINNEYPGAVEQNRLIRRGRQIAEELGTLAPDQTRAILLTLFSRVDIRPDRVEINIRRCYLIELPARAQV